MLTAEQNALLTEVGPGTPGGELLRRYWQPVALAEELDSGAPVPLKILGEELVLFRDESGQPGLLGLHCSHRGADLSYGRLEDGGLRCLYHGWLFDRAGRCLEQPGEPAGSAFHERIRHPSYPCHEAIGIVFAYVGPGDPPLFPGYEFLEVPPDQAVATKYWHACGYLQGNEGNIDPVHLSFLHRFLSEDEIANRPSGRSGGLAGTSASSNALFGHDLAPQLEVETTDFGLRLFAIRDIGDGRCYVRVSNFIFPNLSAFPGGGEYEHGDGYGVNWHVPIDDTHHWKFTISFDRYRPLDRAGWLQLSAGEVDASYHLRRTRENRYLQDRSEMQTRSFCGLGPFFAGHDALAVEGLGPVQDRTREHTATSDKAIVAARLQLLAGVRDVQEGRNPLHLIRTADANHLEHVGAVDGIVGAGEDWHVLWQRKLPTH